MHAGSRFHLGLAASAPQSCAFADVLLLLPVLIGLPASLQPQFWLSAAAHQARPRSLVVSIISTALLLVTIFSVVILSLALTSPKTCLNGAERDGASSRRVSRGRKSVVGRAGHRTRPVLSAFVVCLPA